MAEAVEKIKVGKMNVREAEVAVDLILEETIAHAPLGAGEAERICRFESILATSLANLKEQGTSARASTERYGDKLYISICIG